MSDDDDLLAAETALGLLHGEEQAAAVRRQLSDPAFAAAVDAWRDRLAPLFDEIGPVAPPPELWTAIEARLPDARGPDVVQLAANDNARGWRIATLAASALALVLAAVLFWPNGQPAPPDAPQLAAQDYEVAQLQGDIEGLLLTARYDPESAELRVRVEGMPETELVPELWIAPEGGQAESLGLVEKSGVSRLAVAPAHQRMIAGGGTLVLTMEPPEGRAPGAAAGAAVATGRLRAI